MKISIISPDLSNNCLIRAYLLAKMLQRQHEVEIVGPVLGESIWGPLKDDLTIRYKYIRISGKIRPYFQLTKLLPLISGDVVYASKPIFTSYGIGLFAKFLKGKKLILDIDDWQMGFRKEAYSKLGIGEKLKTFLRDAPFVYKHSSLAGTFMGEKLVFLADAVTVSNSYLQQKFGGTVVPHARDTDYFNPKNFNREKMRKKYNIDPGKKIILFMGSFVRHKGVEDLVKSVELIKENNIILMLVGINPANKYDFDLLEILNTRLPDRHIVFGLQPFDIVPEFLALADIAVIPQRKNYASLGQTPVKIFDAMAMAKPIISSNVNNIPEILEDCGWLVDPENPDKLSKTIRYVLENDAEAAAMGKKARIKCEKYYSYDVVGEALSSLIGCLGNRTDKKLPYQ